MSQPISTDTGHILPQLKRPVLVANSCNFAGIAVAIFSFAFPSSIAVVIIMFLFPPAMFVLYLRYAGQLSLIGSQNTWRYPATLAIAFALSVFAMFFTGVARYTLLSWVPVYIAAIVLAAIPIICFLRFIRPRIPKADFDRSFALTILCAILYNIGAIATANCRFDYHRPKVYYDTILSANEESGYRYRTHYLTLDNLGPAKGQHDIEVSEEMFNNSFRGQLVYVLVSPGLFHIPAYNLMLGPIIKK